MALQAIMDSLDEVPEHFRELYTEKNGQFELTGISGMKTQADVDRLTSAIQKERDEHKATKDRLGLWSDLDHDDVMAKLDRFPELEAAAAGKIDDAAIEEMVTKRVSGTINSQTAPLQRQIDTLTKQLEEVTALAEQRGAEITAGKIKSAVRRALNAGKVIPEAQEDALMLAERIFEVREDDGEIVTRDQVGVTPGIGPDVWLTEMQTSRPHWWPGSVGTGARGAGGGGNGGYSNNPFSHEHWNMTKQGEVLRSQGREKAEQMAKAAGTTIGGPRPQPRK